MRARRGERAAQPRGARAARPRDPARGVRPRTARAAAPGPDRQRRARERHGDIWVERRGRLEKTVARFKDDAHLMRIIEKIVSAVGRRIDESNPMVDARLPDGSRVNVIIPPLALDGPMMSIRRFAADPFSADDLIEIGTLTRQLMDAAERRREGAPERADLRRHGRRQDDPAERALGLHPERRAHRHDRGRGRAAAEAGARGAARDAARQPRGHRPGRRSATS